jgi:hypothetical protein
MLAAKLCAQGARVISLGALLAGCAGRAAGSPAGAGGGGSGAGDAGVPAAGAGGGFGNVSGSSPTGGATRATHFIDDGGIAVLADGAMLYAKFFARPCPSASTLTYDNFGASFFQSYCLRCHSRTKQGTDRNDAPATLNFDQLTDIQVQIERIWGQAGDSNVTMPAGPPKPSPDERARLGEWLACGAPGDQPDAH